MPRYQVKRPDGTLLAVVDAATLREALVKADQVPEPVPEPLTVGYTSSGRKVELEP